MKNNDKLEILQAIQIMSEKFDTRFEAIDNRFEAIDSRFEAIDSRFESIESRLDRIESTMVTKDYLDRKLAADRRLTTLVDMLHENKGLSSKQVKALKGMEPFAT